MTAVIFVTGTCSGRVRDMIVHFWKQACNLVCVFFSITDTYHTLSPPLTICILSLGWCTSLYELPLHTLSIRLVATQVFLIKTTGNGLFITWKTRNMQLKKQIRFIFLHFPSYALSKLLAKDCLATGKDVSLQRRI